MNKYKNKFYWNEETLNYFKDLKNKNEEEFYRKVNEFVKYECDLEEGEYREDLQTDLIIQVINKK
mgnify:FL=1